MEERGKKANLSTALLILQYLKYLFQMDTGKTRAEDQDSQGIVEEAIDVPRGGGQFLELNANHIYHYCTAENQIKKTMLSGIIYPLLLSYAWTFTYDLV